MKLAPHTASGVLAFAVALSACGPQSLDVGSNNGGAGTAGFTSNGASAGTSFSSAGQNVGGQNSAGTSAHPSGGASTLPSTPHEDPVVQEPWPDPASCSTDPSALEGTWSGYVQGQGHEWDFTLVFAGGGDTPCGTLTFGEPQTYEPATDPQAGYLPQDRDIKNLYRAPGYTYQLLSVDVTGARTQFRVSFAQPYASWCAIQTSYHDDLNGGYSCVQTYADGAAVHGDDCVQTDADGIHHTVPCVQFDLCESIDPPCVCDADDCQPNLEGSGPYFDLHFDGDTATGVMNDEIVYLQKD